MTTEIVSTHIENDIVNNAPTLVFTDATGQEWVHEEQTTGNSAFITKLVKKQDSWYFKPENKKK